MNTEERQELIKGLSHLVAIAERFQKAYFFRSPQSASERRRYERIYSVPQIEWKDGNDIYGARYEVRCSCNHVYAKGFYTKNGDWTTLTAVRNSLKRLIDEQNDEMLNSK